MEKNSKATLIPIEIIEEAIYIIRGQRVILDRDLAKLYTVETRSLNQAVKRNLDRFPEDFMFQLSQQEFKNWISQFVTSNSAIKMGFRKPPFAFTEHGAIMVASLLKSPEAISVSVEVVRAFVRLRKLAYSHSKIIEEMNSFKSFALKESQSTRQELRKVWAAINKLMSPAPEREVRRIGFRLDEYQD